MLITLMVRVKCSRRKASSSFILPISCSSSSRCWLACCCTSSTSLLSSALRAVILSLYSCSNFLYTFACMDINTRAHDTWIHMLTPTCIDHQCPQNRPSVFMQQVSAGKHRYCWGKCHITDDMQRSDEIGEFYIFKSFLHLKGSIKYHSSIMKVLKVKGYRRLSSLLRSMAAWWSSTSDASWDFSFSALSRSKRILSFSRLSRSTHSLSHKELWHYKKSETGILSESE